ncbi:MAG: HIT family protein, partial [Actinomycetota bacterium]
VRSRTMDRLWTPWRMQYVGIDKPPEGCVFCDHLAEDDDENTNILYRGDEVFVILNAFPYNTGHVMVAPKRHVADVGELTDEERFDLFDVTCKSIEIIRTAMRPHGFNTGMNLGQVAGAGIPGHLHMHVVPRWGGDTNFMPVVGNTKVLPEMLAETAAKLRPGFAAI